MKQLAFFAFALFFVNQAQAFCGFYVAKADASLFNRSSQVILVKNGTYNVITMASDYKGEVKDFAMVVPVPKVLTREQIRTVAPAIFSKLDAYTGPRLVEYHDPEPCYSMKYSESMSRCAQCPAAAKADSETPMMNLRPRQQLVKIEARYEVDEYEILILSAKESTALETWLVQNGYKMPSGAAEVLRPYITAGMKFFVAKVNLKNFNPSGNNNLSPLQISFESDKFMLPIRLGMANAEGDQDLIMYCLTVNGRTEAVNYRTAPMPTNRNIPEFIATRFSAFYPDVFRNAWEREGRTAIMLEYAWNISGQAPVKCDPCPQTENGPLTSLSYEELQQIGVNWVTKTDAPVNSWMGGGTSYMGNLFVTRLHARYNRRLYPQDFVFQETQNRENFQCRYVMNHPAQDVSCPEAQTYLAQLLNRRNMELLEMAHLTGWDRNLEPDYISRYGRLVKGEKEEHRETGEPDRNFFGFFRGNEGNGSDPWMLMILLCISALVLMIPGKFQTKP